MNNSHKRELLVMSMDKRKMLVSHGVYRFP